MPALQPTELPSTISAPQSTGAAQRISWKTRVLWFIPICIVAIAVYWPTVRIVTTADLAMYFSETAGVDDLSTLVTRFYSYNRTAQYMPGDSLMFRPGVFIDLAVRKWAFGAEHPECWQASALASHLLMCFALLILLTEIWPSRAAALCVLLFSVLVPGKFVVHYAHVSSFVLALALLHISIYLALRYLRNPATHVRTAVLIAVSMTIAAFTLEMFAPFSVFILAYLLLELRRESERPLLETLRRNGVLLILLLPPVLYATLNFWDASVHSKYIGNEQMQSLNAPNLVLGAFKPLETLYAIVALPLVWLLQSVFVDLLVAQWFNLARVPLFVSMALALLGGTFWIATKLRRKGAMGEFIQRNAVSFLVAAMALFMIVTYVVFRINPRGPQYADIMRIYPYFFWSFLLVIVCDIANRHAEFIKRRATVLAALMLGLAALNAAETNASMRSLAEVSSRQYTFIREAREFVDAHNKEPGFSISIPESPYLFARYRNNSDPRYLLKSDRDGHIIVNQR